MPDLVPSTDKAPVIVAIAKFFSVFNSPITAIAARTYINAQKTGT